MAHNHAVRRYLRHVLPRADLLTVDKYGIDVSLPYRDDDGSDRADCPRAYLRHDNFDQRLRDYAAVIARLRQQGGYRRVVAVGGSEGAVVANMLAARGGLVDASIAFNGGGRWFLDDVLHSIGTGDAPPAEKAQAIEGSAGLRRPWRRRRLPTWWRAITDMTGGARPWRWTSRRCWSGCARRC
ncbi:hypothetical protein WJ971_12600 [Achromobacter xylosoxidans]